METTFLNCVIIMKLTLGITIMYKWKNNANKYFPLTF